MQEHVPVLLDEVLLAFDYLKKEKNVVFVDGTLGAAGHSVAISKNLLGNKDFKIIGVDKDQMALDIANKNITRAGLTINFELIHSDYKDIKNILTRLKISKINGGLIDLGVSSMQLDYSHRGFSFKDRDQLLDMRMDQDQELTAKIILDNYSIADLEKILFEYGEEKFGKSIARNIAESRKIKPFYTIGNLLDVLERAIPAGYRKKSRIHYATKTFQALRIEVNGELTSIEQTIRDFVSFLKPNSRLAVITFHSLEDRIVKNTFRNMEDPCVCPKELPICLCGNKPTVKILTKKPIIASTREIANNPRSRSAKLRIIEKI